MSPSPLPTRPVYDDSPAGMTCLGELSPQDFARLDDVLRAGRESMREAWAASAARGEIFWINLWQRSAPDTTLPLTGAAELAPWVAALVEHAYGDTRPRLDGYGFIVNPVGSRAQPWHVDYTLDYSTIFIPLTRLTTQNATQYAVLPASLPARLRQQAFAYLDNIDLDALVATAGHLSVRQLLARPGAIIKMDFGTLHRGVANTGDFERVMFWISVSRTAALLPVEPSVEVIR